MVWNLLKKWSNPSRSTGRRCKIDETRGATPPGECCLLQFHLWAIAFWFIQQFYIGCNAEAYGSLKKREFVLCFWVKNTFFGYFFGFLGGVSGNYFWKSDIFCDFQSMKNVENGYENVLILRLRRFFQPIYWNFYSFSAAGEIFGNSVYFFALHWI